MLVETIYQSGFFIEIQGDDNQVVEWMEKNLGKHIAVKDNDGTVLSKAFKVHGASVVNFTTTGANRTLNRIQNKVLNIMDVLPLFGYRKY